VIGHVFGGRTPLQVDSRKKSQQPAPPLPPGHAGVVDGVVNGKPFEEKT
jgi:hypothetical protein